MVVVLSDDDFLRLLPKTELHCHFASTMSAEQLIRLAAKYSVALPTADPQKLFAYTDLADFLVAFRAAHDVLKTPDDFAEVAYEGVGREVAAAGLRYREYYVNPQYFVPRGLGYRQVLDALIDGLRGAEADFGVGFRIVVAINRNEPARGAVELVELMRDNPYPEVVGLGQDDLTPELTEDPGRFTEAYALAKRIGLRTTAHAGETPHSSADEVRVAINDLGVDRVDHGYRILDDPALVEQARESQIPFTCTPFSTTICSGWSLDPQHRIRRMIDAGLNVTVSTDDAVFFRTDLAREYAEALPALGITVEQARAIALAGVDGSFLDDADKRSLRARFGAEIAGLDARRGTDLDPFGSL